MKLSEVILSQIYLNLLNAILAAAKDGHPIHKQFGLSQETFEQLSRLSSIELISLAKTPFLDARINDRSLAMTINSIIKSRDRQELVRDAMRYGASRDIMQHYANLTENAFNRLRIELGLIAERRRPPKIRDDEYLILASAHSEYGSQQNINDRMGHLRCLVYLTERTGIDINRIYHYYYTDNSMLFAKPAGDQTL